MKKSFSKVFAAALLLFMIGCKKETQVANTSIQGLWELKRASGMFSITYPPGNGNTIKFTGNHYEITSNGQITQSGGYEIIRDLSVETETCLVIAAGQYSNRIIYDNNTNGRKEFIQISGNKLSFLSGCFAYDGGSLTEYERQ